MATVHKCCDLSKFYFVNNNNNNKKSYKYLFFDNYLFTNILWSFDIYFCTVV